jgi:starch synthase
MSRSVLIIGSEALPFSKTGGLADVLGALPPALAGLGWDVTLALPRYRGVVAGSLADRLSLVIGGGTRSVGVFEAAMADRVRVWLVECEDLFDRDGLYGVGSLDYPDNALRFALLVRAALEYAARRGIRPSVVHAHDWQAGLAPVYLATRYQSHPVLGGTPSVFTIHNLAYQGLFSREWLPRLDLGWDLFTVDRLEFWGRVSFLKGGVNDADLVTTVSPTYAREIQTPDLGFGFDGILRHRAADLVGVLNGIDTTAWDPRCDPAIPAPYDADHLEAKAVSKRALFDRYGLPADDQAMRRPLVGLISRMVDQKGFDLIASVAPDLPSLDAAFVGLGTGEARYEDLVARLAATHPGRFAFRIGFDENLAHLIEAGADIFLMPSRFEPCGLNQMYSLRYGTVPVVRAVGGLADTVRDYSPGNRFSTGFVFRDYSPEALLSTLRRALDTYRDARRWRTLQRAGMRQDNSWDRRAREYVKMYDRAITKAGRRRPQPGGGPERRLGPPGTGPVLADRSRGVHGER